MSIQTPVIAGNWKLNHGPERTRAFLESFVPRLPARVKGTIVLFPPSLSLPAARSSLEPRDDVLLGVQNVYWEASGAFTGEISAPLAREAGADMVLVGHSERRHVFGESDADTVRKVRAVLDAGLSVILCVGETLQEREDNQAFAVVERQLEAVAATLARGELSRFLVAYEPVWAIGTGRTAQPGDASEMHGHVRRLIVGRFAAAATGLPILYGGSVKPDNASALLDSDDVDGLLVGGASLDAEAFARICSLSA